MANDSAGFARNPRWLQAAGCRLQASVDRWVAAITFSTALHFSLKPGDWSLQPHDAAAEKIVAPREESRKQ
jgi:hypothetical protein